MTWEGDQGEQIGARIAGVFLPMAVTAHLLSNWLPKPLAWAGSNFVWLLVIYWFPSRSGMRLRRWVIIVSVLSILAAALSILLPDLL
jgi:hypothetical protein